MIHRKYADGKRRRRPKQNEGGLSLGSSATREASGFHGISPGKLQFIHNMSPDESLRNAVMLAKAAKAYGMPVVLTSSQEEHIQGPIAPALQQLLPEAYNNRIKRVGIVNAWADPNFSGAVRVTGRKHVIMGGVTTDMCLIFPSISAVQEGFSVLAVMDASGSSYEVQENLARSRMERAGVDLSSTCAEQ
jgi:nicotinamidase-related amidase